MAVLAGKRVEEADAGLAQETNRHGFGEPRGKKLSLHLLEAAYLVAAGKMKVEARAGKKRGRKPGKAGAKKGNALAGGEVCEEDLVALALKSDALAKEKYSLLKEFRSKGHCVRFVQGEPWLRVYEKGKRYGEAPSLYLVRVAGEAALAKEADMAHKVRKKLVLAVAGKKGIAFYRVERTRF